MMWRVVIFSLLVIFNLSAHAATMCIPDYSTYTDTVCGDINIDGGRWSTTCGGISVSGVVIRTNIVTTVGDFVTVSTNKISELVPGTGCFALVATYPYSSDYAYMNCWLCSYQHLESGYTLNDLVVGNGMYSCCYNVYNQLTLADFYVEKENEEERMCDLEPV